MSTKADTPNNDNPEPPADDILKHGPSEAEKKIHPLERTWWINQIFYCWVNQCISISKKHPWQQEYHYN